ncbi:MAG: cytochrome b/b6 domain-containing protein [Desulfobacca sp.]|nr:cytochrome b/b6 domain-containing protein [Desulfobacca sp.]
MERTIRNIKTEELDDLTIILHAGLMVFGVLAWFTGEWAGDYKKMVHLGFTVHKWLGMGTALFIGARLFHGLYGPDQARFAHWVPYTWERLQLVCEDLRTLLTLKLPNRSPHQGLAGLWEAFGLVIFTWMTTTGFCMFFFLAPGQKARGLMHLVKELHEFGGSLVPIFLAIHVAAVILHALTGDHRWRKMFGFSSDS